MKPERGFVAERALARHCPELLARGPDLAALRPLLARSGERLARHLSGALAPLLGGEAPLLRCAEPTETTAQALAAELPGLAAHALFGFGEARLPLLASIAAAGIFRIVDRAFGGKGLAPNPLPAAFPMAAELMIARLEALIATQLGAALAAACAGDATLHPSAAFALQRRDSVLASLAPFAPAEPLLSLIFEVKEEAGEPWKIRLALPEAALAALFGIGMAAPRAPRTAPVHDSAALPPALGALALTLTARLVDMRLPFATVATLAPGMILPVSVARQVPLAIGEQRIARGTIGEIDDCVALQLTTMA
ncbi:MAG: FliM/FliN family flagellar motor switch protein [Sphingomonadales bacterium]|nr:FliM/FliN family flagellar motor switch protein [Sphingomonadales bacterium]